MKSIIITSGGTSEKIDDVRTITNISSGRLALSICLNIRQTMENVHIYYLCSETALKPSILIPDISIIKVGDTKSLTDAISILKDIKPCAVIHSMAVSDYKPEKTDGKISSSSESLSISLSANPKAIDLIRHFFPDTLLFGFKLESRISAASLADKGKYLMRRSNADYIVMNLVEEISMFFHRGYIMDRDYNIISFYSKSDCSNKISTILKRRL